MKCEKCQELLGDFLDGTLTGEDHALFGKHLEDCLSCADVREEMSMILLAARECGETFEAPPNERALWLRISNTIESERDPDWVVAAAAGASPSPRASAPRAGVWSRLLGMRWELTLPQLTTAVAGIIVAVALATALGVQRVQTDDLADPTVAGGDAGERRGFSQAPRFNVADYARRQEELLSRQQVNISYWQQRVEQRKASWNPRMRDSFDRSINVIDEAVSESLNELKTNPHDEVAEEMLNGALRNKLEFLKEFSEQ